MCRAMGEIIYHIVHSSHIKMRPGQQSQISGFIRPFQCFLCGRLHQLMLSGGKTKHGPLHCSLRLYGRITDLYSQVTHFF